LSVIGALFRIYSYLYHLLLALLLLGIAVVSMDSHTLHLGMLPWKGRTLICWLFGVSLFGLLSIILAWLNRLRILFLLYSLIVFGMMARGYFLGGYAFSGKDEFRFAICLTVGALFAIVGAWSQFRKTGKRR
jgi:hypothetical protein